jgi:hypothetical protein
MSAKRSFDVRRSAPAKRSKAPSVRRSSSRTRKPVKVRRREKTQMAGFFIFLGVMVVCGGFIYLLWRPEIRISQVEASGVADPSTLEASAKEQMEGAYFNVFPKDSFFLYPERSIRAAILELHPNVSAVSISRTGFTSIALKTIARASAFEWCGEPGAASSYCFEADAEGLVFAPAVSTGTTSEALRVYALLETASSTTSYPLKARVKGAEHIPDILRFSRAIKSLGIPVESIAIRGDEADLYVPQGTRITYVIGHEEAAAKGAEASFARLNLMDGSLEYVDLRFDGKVYLKRRGE